MQKCHTSYQYKPWEEYIPWLDNQWKGKSLTVTIHKLCLASTIYTIWTKCNSYHNNSYRSANSISISIPKTVYLKFSSFSKFKDKLANRAIQQDWDIPSSIFS